MLTPGRATGPRTSEGKAISSRNAWRHGLTVPIRADPFWRPAVVELERELAREDAAAPREFVRLVAEAVIELSRIARVHEALIGGADGDARIDAMRKLDRYEGRAHAKKWRAFRLYPAHLMVGGVGKDGFRWRRGHATQNELDSIEVTAAVQSRFANRTRRPGANPVAAAESHSAKRTPCGRSAM